MLELLFNLPDISVSTAQAEEKPPAIVIPNCSFKDPQKIRECLDKKFKDDRDPHPEMWDPNWIKKP